jgi:hypothetical protein
LIRTSFPIDDAEQSPKATPASSEGKKLISRINSILAITELMGKTDLPLWSGMFFLRTVQI